MSVREDSNTNATWRGENGDVVQLPDSFIDMSEHISSLMNTAEIADVESVLNEFGHEDVTLLVSSETDGQIRELSFTVIIENWRQHSGGVSAYSSQDMVDYRSSLDSEEPDEHMYSNGAFFHKLGNRLSDLFAGSGFEPRMFQLSGYNDSEVRFNSSVTLHRYDYV